MGHTRFKVQAFILRILYILWGPKQTKSQSFTCITDIGLKASHIHATADGKTWKINQIDIFIISYLHFL